MKKNIIIDLKNNTFLKRVSTDNILLEIESSTFAYHVSQKTNLFKVPNILDYNKKEGWIKFEFINNIHPLKDVLHNHNELVELIPKIGKCLAFIHNNFQLNEKVELPLEINLPDQKNSFVFLHGDFNLNNVQYRVCDKEIFIIDWALTPLFPKSANWGTFYWDICWMINSIIAEYPLNFYRNKYREQLAILFIINYMKHSTLKIEKEILGNYLYRLSNIFKNKSKSRYHWSKYLSQWKNRDNLRIFSKKIHEFL